MPWTSTLPAGARPARTIPRRSALARRGATASKQNQLFFPPKNVDFGAVQKYANLVELEKCSQTHIFLQNFVLIPPRTSPPKICKILFKKLLILLRPSELQTEAEAALPSSILAASVQSGNSFCDQCHLGALYAASSAY